jgi:hypothetical protein
MENDKEEIMRTYTKDDLRLAHSLLRFFKDNGFDNDPKYKEMVRTVRRFQNNEPTIKHEYFNDDLDGYIEKITFPTGYTPSNARIYFAQNIYIERPAPSMYDCTGRLWTDGIHTAVLHGQVVIYHKVSRDV